MEPSVFDISSVQELVRGSLNLGYNKNRDSNQFTVFEMGILNVFSSKRTFYLVSAQTASFTIARRSITDGNGLTAPEIDSSEKSILAEGHKYSNLQGMRKFRKYCNSHTYSFTSNASVINLQSSKFMLQVMAIQGIQLLKRSISI